MAGQRKAPVRVQEEEEDIFSVGDLIQPKYQVVRRLGKGGYGEIYEAKEASTNFHVAIKVERTSKPGNLLEEEKILKNLNENGAKYVPRLLGSGRHEDSVNYIILELLGDNLSNLRRKIPSHKFSILTTMRLGIQMLRSLKEVHDLGYLHRDIKPGNFVMGSKSNGTNRTVILIDFGLSRRHFRSGEEGGVRPKRKTARWVGSRRYMSINTHQRKDQGRRDDLWSFLYVLIEFVTGTLPWAHLRGIQNLVLDQVRDMKILYNNEKLVKGLPEEFSLFMTHIKELRYEDRPDYEYLHGLMQRLYDAHGGDNQTPFDWEAQSPLSQRTRVIDYSIPIDGKRNTGEIIGSGYRKDSARTNNQNKENQSSTRSDSEQDLKRKTLFMEMNDFDKDVRIQNETKPNHMYTSNSHNKEKQDPNDVDKSNQKRRKKKRCDIM